MSAPAIEEVEQMSPSEIEHYCDENGPEEGASLREEKQWFRIMAVYAEKTNPSKPPIFSEGAVISIEYMTGNEEIIPVSNVGGRITEADEKRIVVEDNDTAARYVVDLTEYTVETNPLTRNPRKTGESGDLFKLQLTEPPWESKHDGVAGGVALPMMYSEYNWVREGFYMYPPKEFFSDKEVEG